MIAVHGICELGSPGAAQSTSPAANVEFVRAAFQAFNASDTGECLAAPPRTSSPTCQARTGARPPAGARTGNRVRRRFLKGRPVRWFVYLNAPVSRLAAVIDLGPAVAGSPDDVWPPVASGSAGFSAPAGEEGAELDAGADGRGESG